jgi:hypothetical protein
MAQGVSCLLLNTETRVRFQAIPCEICGEKIGTVSGFSPSTLVFPWQYRGTRGGAVVEALRYKPEGRGFDS